MQNTSLKFSHKKPLLNAQQYLQQRFISLEELLPQMHTSSQDKSLKKIPRFFNFYSVEEDNLDILSLDQTSNNVLPFDILQNVNYNYDRVAQQSQISHSETRNTLKRGLNEQSSLKALQDENKELKKIIEALKNQQKLKVNSQDVQMMYQGTNQNFYEVLDSQKDMKNYQQKIADSERQIQILQQQNTQLKLNQQKYDERLIKNLEILNQKNKKLEELLSQNYILKQQLETQKNNQNLKKEIIQNDYEITQQQSQINQLQNLIENDQNNFFSDRYVIDKIEQTDRKFTFQPTQSQLQLSESNEQNVFQESQIQKNKNFQVSEINCNKDELLSNLSFDKSSPLYRNHSPFKKKFLVDNLEMRRNLLSANESCVKVQNNSLINKNFNDVKDSFNLNHCQEFKIENKIKSRKKIIKLDDLSSQFNYRNMQIIYTQFSQKLITKVQESSKPSLM